jgi:hypothetical protein
MEKRLRRMFFVDFPEQTGDTPPTLGSMARRDGARAAPHRRARHVVLSRGPGQDFPPLQVLLEAAGAIKPITVDGRNVSLLAYNPAQRAAEQQEIATNVQAIQILSQAFPEEFKVQIDGAATMKAIIDKMRAKLITFRQKEHIAGGRPDQQADQGQPGAGGQPGQGAGGAPGGQPQIGP